MRPAGYRKWKRDEKISLTSPPPSPPPKKKLQKSGIRFHSRRKLNKAAKPKSPVHRLICSVTNILNIRNTECDTKTKCELLYPTCGTFVIDNALFKIYVALLSLISLL